MYLQPGIHDTVPDGSHVLPVDAGIGTRCMCRFLSSSRFLQDTKNKILRGNQPPLKSNSFQACRYGMKSAPVVMEKIWSDCSRRSTPETRGNQKPRWLIDLNKQQSPRKSRSLDHKKCHTVAKS